MHNDHSNKRLDDHFRCQATVGRRLVPGRKVLVALRDREPRMEVTAGLVLAGYRVLLASTPDRTASLVRAADVVVADGRLVAGLGRKTHESLRRAVFIAVCEDGSPTPLAARARFTPPFEVDDLVTAVMMLEGPSGAPLGRAAAFGDPR
ncbi:MAG TPA: hypothetical protein VKB80_21865 [Kofleriaceae bacterium]|nr:hypothetical protein [Kofleriaceae bacterium]